VHRTGRLGKTSGVDGLMGELRVLWAGLGSFGLPIAMHCAEQGMLLSPLVVDGHNARGAARLAAVDSRASGAVAQPSDHDVLVLCLPRPADVRAVIGRLGRALPPVVVDLSTGDRASSAALAEELAALGRRYVDAPVSGSPQLARSGGLTVFVGASEGWSEAGERLLRAVGEHLYYFGEAGAGQAAKLVNQLIHLGTLAAVCEGLTFAEAESLDLPLVLEALRNSSANSQMLMRFGPSIANRDFAPRFGLELAAKDMESVSRAVVGHQLDFTVTAAVREILQTALKHNLGSLDVSSMVTVVSERPDRTETGSNRETQLRSRR
jgi:3-hydroxyisobutyrate dehydrogenase-like beta-hydroxyacid dehydrogenase